MARVAGRRLRVRQALGFALMFSGCTAPPAPASGALDGPDAGGTVELIPTSSTVIASCATELGTTFCTAADALTAAEACSQILTPAEQASCNPDAGCLVPYAPTRPGACVSRRTYTSLAQCATPVEDNCAFYRACLDEAHPCDAGGYALGFGEPLCYLFIDHRNNFTPEGQRWLQGVRSCLQRALAPLVATPEKSCKTLADQAFASHTACYTSPDNSFCTLASADVIALAGLLLPYIDNPQVSAQLRAVNAICATRSP